MRSSPSVGDAVVWDRSRRDGSFKMFGVVEAVDDDRITASWSATPSGRPLLRHRAPIEQVTVIGRLEKPHESERVSA